MDKSTKNMELHVRLILFSTVLISLTADGTVDKRLKDQYVFENETVTFISCAEIRPLYLTINKTLLHDLDPSFQNEVVFDTDHRNCYSLKFPAWPEYDNTTISFVYDDREETATLHIQGVLGSPVTLNFEEKNSTHITIMWEEPFSWTGHDNTTYELVITKGNLIERINLSTLSYTFLRPIPSTVFEVDVTAWNPVGQGDTSTLNLLGSLENCAPLDGIIPEPYTYSRNGSVSVLVKLFSVTDGRIYCVGGGFSVAHSVFQEVPPTYYDPVFIDGTAVIWLHNIRKEQHLQIPLLFQSLLQFTIIFSTYAVQNGTWSDDNMMLKCHFLNGTTINTCFAEIYHNNKLVDTQSGSHEYNLGSIIHESGWYQLKVYDHKAQRNQTKPADIVNFETKKRDKARDDNVSESCPVAITVLVTIIVVLGAIVIALVIALVVVLYYRNHSRPLNEVPFDETDIHSSVVHPEEPDGSSSNVYPAPDLPLTENLETGRKNSNHLSRHQCTTNLKRDGASNEEVKSEEQETVTVFNQNDSLPIKSRSAEDRAAKIPDDLQKDTVSIHSGPLEESSV